MARRGGLTARQIEFGLRAIGRKARADGRLIEIAVYGGAAIVLAFNFRHATKDIDVVVSAIRGRSGNMPPRSRASEAGTKAG